ncbi:hypothetical protein [Leifsonia shinshuensis]|uniref:Uncharacterized protein n=1 Tax=Leifsonia shinshuensis TaxID=150026 RepID=A0A853CYN5_9MICO|nr:hypothetical protein [Leifsonia shinshuensis]NYJ24431.1 hypothetical protein [Leifsonia shinshuensis]
MRELADFHETDRGIEMMLFGPERPTGNTDREPEEVQRAAVHAVGALGLLAVPLILIFNSLLTAFRSWGVQDEAARAAIDAKAFPLMVAAGIVMAVAAVAVFILRGFVRSRFIGGNIWVVIAVLALPVACYIAAVG